MNGGKLFDDSDLLAYDTEELDYKII